MLNMLIRKFSELNLRNVHILLLSFNKYHMQTYDVVI